jgi:nucleoside-diphosphate kinase
MSAADMEHTYAMVKPGYEPFWGKVVDRIIDEGLQVVQMKTVLFTDEFAERFYEEHVGKAFFPTLENYMTSAHVLALDIAGPNAILKWREIIGPTKKEVAVEKAPQSLRALYARSTTENLCHGSDSLESAIRELTLVFGSAPEAMIPKLEPAGFDAAVVDEMAEVEALALEYADKRSARSILKQEYLETAVLPLVLEGLSWIIRERPSDPVEHLAMYLLKNNPATAPEDGGPGGPDDSRIVTPQTPPAKGK